LDEAKKARSRTTYLKKLLREGEEMGKDVGEVQRREKFWRKKHKKGRKGGTVENAKTGDKRRKKSKIVQRWQVKGSQKRVRKGGTGTTPV